MGAAGVLAVGDAEEDFDAIALEAVVGDAVLCVDDGGAEWGGCDGGPEAGQRAERGAEVEEGSHHFYVVCGTATARNGWTWELRVGP